MLLPKRLNKLDSCCSGKRLYLFNQQSMLFRFTGRRPVLPGDEKINEKKMEIDMTQVRD